MNAIATANHGTTKNNWLTLVCKDSIDGLVPSFFSITPIVIAPAIVPTSSMAQSTATIFDRSSSSVISTNSVAKGVELALMAMPYRPNKIVERIIHSVACSRLLLPDVLFKSAPTFHSGCTARKAIVAKLSAPNLTYQVRCSPKIGFVSDNCPNQIRAGATNKVTARTMLAIVPGTPNSLISTRFSNPNSKTDIIPKPI